MVLVNGSWANQFGAKMSLVQIQHTDREGVFYIDLFEITQPLSIRHVNTPVGSPRGFIQCVCMLSIYCCFIIQQIQKHILIMIGFVFIHNKLFVNNNKKNCLAEAMEEKIKIICFPMHLMQCATSY